MLPIEPLTYEQRTQGICIVFLPLNLKSLSADQLALITFSSLLLSGPHWPSSTHGRLSAATTFILAFNSIMLSPQDPVLRQLHLFCSWLRNGSNRMIMTMSLLPTYMPLRGCFLREADILSLNFALSRNIFNHRLQIPAFPLMPFIFPCDCVPSILPSALSDSSSARNTLRWRSLTTSLRCDYATRAGRNQIWHDNANP
jgi:hypothetical protein